MNGLIPSFISEQFEGDRLEGALDAAVMFIDISGFSSMTQAMMSNGKEGAEVLADAINRVFSPAIRIIYSRGGFVSSFAGDAFTSIFPSDRVGILDALSAAVSMRELFEEQGLQSIKFGSFSLSVSISLSRGAVRWGIVPHESQNAFHFGGEALTRCTENEQRTESGQVVFDESVNEALDGSSNVDFEKLSNGTYLLRSVDSMVPGKEVHVPEIPCQGRFVPKEVMELNRRGEFRDIVSCYIGFDVRGDMASGISRMISLVHGFGGYFNKVDCTDGGGIMLVLFGAPVNPGNLYRRALDFALAAREVPELRIRMGLACGTAFTGFVGSDLRSEYTALGSVVNLSARFAQDAGQSFILVDEALCRQCGSKYEILELGPRSYKGFEEKVPVHELKGKKSARQSPVFMDRMVGRDREMVLLEDRLQPVRAGRFGGILYIYGNPGVGKSRLVHEFTARHRIGNLLLQTDSILRKPLNPFTYFFRQYFDQDEDLSLTERKELFNARYQELLGRVLSLPDFDKRLEMIRELTRIKSIIGSVIGLYWEGSVFDTVEPDDRQVVTRLAISEFLRAMSLTVPLIIILEDLQWLDEGSEEVLETLTRSAEDYPFIVMVTSRLNDDGSRPRIGGDDQVSSCEILLEDLSEYHAKLLIEERLEHRTDEDLAAYILARTGGNPFYTEQFCLYLRENDIISLRDGIYRLERDPGEIPKDISMVLISRIDRLSEKLKETVQIASVLGREFEIQVLSMLMQCLDGSVPESAASPSRSGVLDLVSRVEEEGIWSALSEFIYMFNHSLLRDAAYDMQLRTRLRDLHRMAGEVISILHSDDMTFYADCAHHFELAEEWDRAREFSEKAGDYFYRSLKYDEALAYRGKALSICLKTLGEMHADTARSFFGMGIVKAEKGDFSGALEYHRKALAVRRELLGEEHPDTASSYSSIGEVCSEMGDYDAALENHDRALIIRRKLLGEVHPDTATSYNDLGAVYLATHKFDTALEHYSKALSIERQTLGEMHHSTACSYNNIGHLHSVMGEYGAALEYYEKALAIQKNVLSEKHPHTATLYNNMAGLYWKKGDYDTALEYSERAHSMQKELLGEKHPSTARSYNNIGVIHSRMGHFDVALAYYERALAIRTEVLGERHPDSINSCNNIGICLQQTGDCAKAMKYSSRALELGREVFGEKHPNTALALGNIARIHASLEEYEKAEELFGQAYGILAGSLGGRHPYAVRTLQNMADMYDAMGRAEEAGEVRARLEENRNGVSE